MAKYKVGITGFGSSVRGFFKEEMAHSNSAVLDSEVYQILARNYDAEFYVLKPTLISTEELVLKKQAACDAFANRFKLCYKDGNYPANLDLIFATQGSENLMLTGSYNGLTLTHAFSFFHTLKMYPRVPIFALQTDYATPFMLPETYGKVFISMFPDLMKERSFVIVPMGVEPEDKKLFIGNYMANALPTHTFKHTTVDQQFIINPDPSQYAFEVTQEPIGIAFAGKARVKGDRSPQLVQIAKSLTSTPMLLIGRWKTEFIDNTIAEQPLLSKTGKYLDHDEVLAKYNEYGFTVYISCPAYRNVKTITSRFTDAIKARCIPLIWHEEVETFKHYFDSKIIDRLTITPDTTEKVIGELQDKGTRQEILEYFSRELEIFHSIAYHEINTFIGQSLNKPKVTHDTSSRGLAPYIKEFFMTYAARPTKDEAKAEQMTNERYEYLGLSFDELILKDPYQAKIATGVYYQYKDRNSWNDVPDLVKDKLRSMLA